VPVRTRLIGAPLRGFEIGEITLEPDEAVVSGPQSLIDRVAALEADVDLTGVRTNFTETLLLHARDDQGGEIKNVTVDPESGVVGVELVQVEFSSPFIVQPVISGTPAPGFVVTGLEVQPPFVVVTGPSDVFQNLDPTQGIPTEPISIDGASADVVRPAALVLPEGARVEQPAITVRVIIVRLNSASTIPTGSSP
jgi:YbbR domain-containing protein